MTRTSLTIGCLLLAILYISCSSSTSPASPSPINDLQALATDTSSVTLSWTAKEAALEYDLRYSTSTISDSNWAEASQCDGEPLPSDTVTTVQFKIEGLNARVDYFFVIKYRLDSTKWSPISNEATAYTLEFDPRNKILFSSEAGICTIAPDGTNRTVLIPRGSNPVWLHDGLSFLFVGYEFPDQTNQLFLTDYKGESFTNISNGDRHEIFPSVDPMHNRIVFSSPPDTGWGNSSLYFRNLDGSNMTAVSTEPYSTQLEAAFSPDGTKIAFTCLYPNASSGDDRHVLVMNSDGTNWRDLAERAHFPAWSPDGLKIAYASYDQSYYQLMVMNSNGSGKFVLTDVNSEWVSPSWSPDGNRLVFNDFIGGDHELFIINADGTGLIQITDNNESDYKPVWSPFQ